ncbi:MAG: nucleotidyltransferase domain-containing protein [Terracoccus sp.]
MATELAEVARRADEATVPARSELVNAVRIAASEGMTQTQIAQQIGRSQPEVSRLPRFHETSPLALRLRADAGRVRKLVAEAGGSRVRVFGSVATGQDRPDSDVDLLFTMSEPLSLMELGRLEQRLGDVIGARVDLVPRRRAPPRPQGPSAGRGGGPVSRSTSDSSRARCPLTGG